MPLLIVNAKYSLGQVVATRGVMDLALQNPAFWDFVQASLNRHAQGDWGVVDAGDKRLNNQALKEGARVLSAYDDPRFPKNGINTIWIITEADRSATTILFPNEY